MALVAYAYDHGRRPSEVYEDYLDHREDYELLLTFGAFRAEVEEEERKKAARPGRR